MESLKFLLCALFIAVLIFGCVQQQPKTLPAVEVGQYQGQKLSSASDFVDTSIKGIQYINISNYTLEISGDVSNPENLTYSEVLSHQAYSKVVTLDCVEGWSATVLWQGVLLKDLLAEAGAKSDAQTVIFTGSDGYTTSLPYSYINQNDILLAYEMNNVTLPPSVGYPFIVVAEDKWGYKWAEWVTGIEVGNSTDLTGYWESRGYSDTGNLNESFVK